MANPHVSRYGKRFYRTDDGDDIPKKIRQWSKHEFVTTDSREDTKSLVRISEKDLQRYIAISPIIQVSLIKIETNRYDNVFKLLIEPYGGQSANVGFYHGVAVNLYKAIFTGISDISNNTYSSQVGMDSEKLIELFDFEKIEQSSIMYFYYDDLAHDVISAINIDQGYSIIDHIYDTMISDHNTIKIQDAVSNAIKCIDDAMNIVMGTYRMHRNEIDDLIKIVVDKKVVYKSQSDSLNKLLRFTNKVKNYLVDPMIVNTLFVLEYNDKIDLDQLKNENRLYTILIVRVRDALRGKAYVVMYKEPPIEYRPESNTGFSKDELCKLLRY